MCVHMCVGACLFVCVCVHVCVCMPTSCIYMYGARQKECRHLKLSVCVPLFSYHVCHT